MLVASPHLAHQAEERHLLLDRLEQWVDAAPEVGFAASERRRSRHHHAVVPEFVQFLADRPEDDPGVVLAPAGGRVLEHPGDRGGAVPHALAGQQGRHRELELPRLLDVGLRGEEGDALRDPAGVGHDDDDDPRAAEVDDLDVRDVRARERRVLHDRDLPRQAREGPDGAYEQIVEVTGVLEERADRGALRGGQRTHLRQVVHEDAVPLVRGHATGRRVGCGDELLVLQQRHVVADRGGGHAELMPIDDRLAADGLARVHVVLDDRPQHLQSAFRDHHPSSAGTLEV